MSLSLAEFQAGLESVTTDYGRQLLLTHATNFGDPFIRLYYKQFPVATMANGQTKTKNTDTMNIQVNLSVDPKAIDALNNLAAAISGHSSGVTYVTEAPREAPPAPEEAPVPEAPKKVKKSPPTPKTPVEAVEPDPLKDVPTGAELKDRIIPLKGTGYPQKLRDYMDGPLGLKGVLLVAVTDVDALKKIDDKITELLKEAAAEADEV